MLSRREFLVANGDFPVKTAEKYCIKRFETATTNSLNVEAGSCGKLPLHTAAEVNNVKAVKLLLQHRANPFPEQTCCYGLQPIHVACIHGAVDVLTYFLDDSQFNKGIMLSMPDRDGSLPLHWAVMQLQLECVRVLLQRGASILVSQVRGLKATPLQLAFNRNALSILQLMVELAPSKDLRVRDTRGHTALSMAVLMDSEEVVVALVQKGSPLQVLDSSGCNLAHLAVSKGSWRVLPRLLQAGVDPFFVDVDERTAVHHAVLAGYDLSECCTFGEITVQKADWRQNLNLPDKTGFVAIHYAVRAGKLSLVKGLLHLGADIHAKSQKQMTALHFAARHGFREILILLISFGNGHLGLNIRDYKGRTALHIAAAHGHSDIVDVLCLRGGIPLKDHSGQTPLHYAAAANHYQTLKNLMDNYADIIDEEDHLGHTALHSAAVHDAGLSISFLLSNKASFQCGSCNPLDLAILNRKENAAMAFVTSGQWKAIIERSSSHFDSIIAGLIVNLPNVMKYCLDRSMERHSGHKCKGEPYVRYDFSVLKPDNSTGKGEPPIKSVEKTGKGREKEQKSHLEPLKIMAVNKRTELLTHPICTTLLEQKWIIYGLYLSAFILVVNSLFVGLLSFIVVYSVDYSLRPYLLNLSLTNLQNYTQENITNSVSYTELRMEVEKDMKDFGRVPDWAIVLLFLAALIILAKEIADLITQKTRYWRDWTNYIQLALFLSTLSFVICLAVESNFEGQDRHVILSTYESAAIAVFLAWFNLIRFFRPFGAFGIYSFIFFTILRTLVQVALFFFILTAAFSGAFFTLFPTFIFPNDSIFYTNPDNYEPEELRTTHETVETSAMRIASLMLGDLEAFERFLSPYMENMLPFKGLSFVFYGLCMVIMCILLNNLLMGLALADMANIRQNAVILRLKMQISLHDSLEQGLLVLERALEVVTRGTVKLPYSWRQNLHCGKYEYRYYPGRPMGWKTWLARLVSGGYNREYQPSDTDNALDKTRKNAIQITDDIKEILKRLREMDESMDTVRQILTDLNKNPSQSDC
ncbi:transient receptor potential cation channel subfamily A member 1-like isoform X2 [Paramacrobiotus metropolitanus]|uniref:transient receptor potential cation channel subfamily A member 1-like isoform X2 n=1 Tax=Paramacrobiotus metropolitanus TaxID=2943436 RepID=UPI0024460DE5|nr:transient receptor potential cation channel subfamily A member 1-like isoform X2 [Paramacrobiotus metropolitanus]